jgi:hypothetical protein
MARKKKVQQEVVTEEVVQRYPDLLPALELLKVRLEEENKEHEVVLKWLELLQKTEQEMRHLERIENLSGAFMRTNEN